MHVKGLLDNDIHVESGTFYIYIDRYSEYYAVYKSISALFITKNMLNSEGNVI